MNMIDFAREARELCEHKWGGAEIHAVDDELRFMRRCVDCGGYLLVTTRQMTDSDPEMYA